METHVQYDGHAFFGELLRRLGKRSLLHARQEARGNSGLRLDVHVSEVAV